ncbi:unnamed protein product [Lota lota]
MFGQYEGPYLAPYVSSPFNVPCVNLETWDLVALNTRIMKVIKGVSVLLGDYTNLLAKRCDPKPAHGERSPPEDYGASSRMSGEQDASAPISTSQEQQQQKKEKM